MRTLFFFLLLTIGTVYTFAHDVRTQHLPLKQWAIKDQPTPLAASFYMLKNETLFLEDEAGKIVSIPLVNLSAEDKEYALERNRRIVALNQIKPTNSISHTNSTLAIFGARLLALLCLLMVLLAFTISAIHKQKLMYVVPVWVVGLGSVLLSFSEKSIGFSLMSTSPATVDSAFAPFKPNVHTFWDTNYFYVESKGIPTTHTMMVGISNHGWQQQVPIPQCYLGTNAWPIPLHPVMAANPIPVDNIHFTRGAIAIAANGVPIFNVHTNTGVDSYTDGQLDAFGGHCGRADDYHYHIAPLHLYTYTTANLPIAYGLDGFPVFGSVEPDGSAMQPLDANHGHAYNGGYHYHGTASAPYMIAQMAGQVTEDNTHQLIPQPAAHPVRPALTPLNGALITGCAPNATNNGYNLTYTRNGSQNSIEYAWSQTGQYVFKFYANGNLDSTKNYNGFVQCSVPDALVQMQMDATDAIVFPNPNNGAFGFQLGNQALRNGIKGIALFSSQGKLVYQTSHYQSEFDLRSLPKGIYFLRLTTDRGEVTKKVMVQ